MHGLFAPKLCSHRSAVRLHQQQWGVKSLAAQCPGERTDIAALEVAAHHLVEEAAALNEIS